MDIQHAPVLPYDPWCVVLSCLDSVHWLGVAGTLPSLDAVVVYYAREQGTARHGFAIMTESYHELRVQLRWGVLLRPLTSEALLQALLPACSTTTTPPSLVLDICLYNMDDDDETRRVLVGLAQCARSIAGLHLAMGAGWSGCPVETMTLLSQLPSLCSLDLSTAELPSTDAWIRAIPHLDRLNLSVHHSAPEMEVRRSEMLDGITDASIAHLAGLQVLRVGHRQSITTVNSFPSLTELDARGGYGITDAGLAQARHLQILDVSWNGKVTDCSHFPELHTLTAIGACGINNSTLASLAATLTSLDVSNNTSVSSVNQLTALRTLKACGFCTIDSNGLKDLRNLTSLDVEGNSRVRSVNTLVSLEELVVSGRSGGLDDAGIAGLVNLRVLMAHGNPAITTVRGFPRLENLCASGACGIGDAGLAGASNCLRELSINGNRSVTTVAHLTSLKELYAENTGVPADEVRAVRLRALSSTANR